HRLHEVAGRTFRLACPPDFPREQAHAFVAQNLAEENFRTWAKARDAQLWVAEIAGVIVGYSLGLLRGPAAEIPTRQPEAKADLNKVYILPEHHGAGVAR